MNTTTTAPIVTEILDLLTRQDVAVVATRPNHWQGVDLVTNYRVVRLAMDDTQVDVYVFSNLRGEPGLMSSKATFSGMPAGVIAATVAAYLTA